MRRRRFCQSRVRIIEALGKAAAGALLAVLLASPAWAQAQKLTEDTDWGLGPSARLRQPPYEGPTPTIIPGARVISTGSTEAKRSLAHHLGAEFVLDHANPNWPAEVRKITTRRGVDLVVEHVGGDVLVKCFDCLARGGTIVTCGATAVWKG